MFLVMVLCKNLSINEVDIDKLDELSEIKISKKKKGNERILEFIKNISNPVNKNIKIAVLTIPRNLFPFHW